jgi:hypothetical protein
LIYEEEVRDIKNRVRDEEMKKINQITKNYDQKLRLIEETKETIIKRNNDLQRLLQNKDRQMEEL